MKNKSENEEDTQNTTHYLPLCMFIGILLGLAVGAASNNISICVPIGLGAGMCLGSFLDRRKLKKENGD